MSPFPLEHLNTHKHGGSFLHSSSPADSGRAVCKRAVPGTSEQPTAESPASPPPTGVSTPHSPWRVSNLRALRWASPPTVCAALQPKRVSDLSALRWTPPPTVCAALQPTRVDRRRTVRHRKSGCPLSIGRLRLYAILIGFRESLFLDGQDQHDTDTGDILRSPAQAWLLSRGVPLLAGIWLRLCTRLKVKAGAAGVAGSPWFHSGRQPGSKETLSPKRTQEKPDLFTENWV